MTLFARIFSLLLLATTLAAQESPEPPKAPTTSEPPAILEAPAEAAIPQPAEPPELGPDELQEPAWDPVAESAAREPSRARTRRGPRQWGDPRMGRTAFGQDIIVRPDESIHELVLIGGSADIQGEVERDVVAVGASVKLSGKVGGDVVIVGGKGTFSGHVDGDTVVAIGSVEVSDTARLDRDAVFLGGPFDISSAAVIGGERVTVPFGDFLPQIEWLKAYLARGPFLGRWLTFHLGWPWVVAGTFAVIYFGLLIAFPAAARSVYTALEERPVTSIFTGLLTMILFAPLTFLLIISVAGIIIVPFLKISLLLALLFGKVGVLCFLGRGLARSSGAARLQVPMLAFVLGAIVLTLSYSIPFFGIFAWAMATVFGLGGAIVALFGTFKREEARVPPAAVLVSTIRPPGRTTPATASGSTGTAPAASDPIPGANLGGGATVADSIPPFTQPADSLSAQDTVLLPRAGFWARLLASILDLFLVAVSVAILPLIGPALFLPVAVAYFVAMWTWKGTTIGSLILSHKVVRTDGGSVDFSVALVRSLLSIFSCAVAFLGCLWAAWDHDKQTWHDKIAGTVVVKTPRGFALV